MTKKSRLHIPSPSARPGDKPDFSYLNLSPAGSVDKPAVEARTRDIEHLSYKLVRVLDDDHQAVGPWNPNIDPGELQIALRWMLLNRVFDKRMWQIQRQGRISFYMEALGEEAVSIAQAMALRPGDMCFPSYRNQGLYMYRGVKLVDMMCQCLSNTRDMCKGRQLPIMYHSREANVFSISGNLGTQYPHAVGWAMASAIKGEDHIAASWVGDGSTAEADFHHALTFAAVYRRPSFSTSSTTSGRFRPSRVLQAASVVRSRHAASASVSPASGSMVTICSPCTALRFGLLSAHAAAADRR